MDCWLDHNDDDEDADNNGDDDSDDDENDDDDSGDDENDDDDNDNDESMLSVGNMIEQFRDYCVDCPARRRRRNLIHIDFITVQDLN